MEPQSGVRTWQWVVTIIVIIVLIIIGIMVFGNKSDDVDSGDIVDNSGTSTQTTTGANRISMTDQYPGNVVYMQSVQLEKTGWVSIHKNNAGKPGEVIGYAKFEKGINPGRITLTQGTTEGGLYYAVLRTDDGDGKFDPAKDLPLKDNLGNDIMKPFRASASVSAEIKG